MNLVDQVKQLTIRVLHLGERGQTLNASTQLLGAIPELDSMAVLNLIVAIEGHWGIHIPDDDVSADDFATLGSLADLVERNLHG